MPIQMTPIVNSPKHKKNLEFKIISDEKWVLERLQSKIACFCEKENLVLDKGW